MRIVCISDTHSLIGRVVVPDGDVLIHAGDLTMTGSQYETELALQTLAELPHRHKVLIAGNHDFYFDPNAPPKFRNWWLTRTRQPEDLLADYPGITYLCDSGTEIDGVRIYGSPWTPWFFDWAFNLPMNMRRPVKWDQLHVEDDQHDLVAARKRWAQIPANTHVLVTHGPPRGILDQLDASGSLPGAHVGCQMLAQRVDRLQQLRLHVFGHIHSGHGILHRGGTRFINASICNEEYKPVQPPIVVDVDETGARVVEGTKC